MKIAQLHTVDQPSNVLEIEKNAAVKAGNAK